MSTRHDFIFIGTGTSSGVPAVTCLTKQPEPTCKVCVAATAWTPPSTKDIEASLAHKSVATPPSFNKNRRNNTCAIYRITHPDGSVKNILIDCGKTFYDSAFRMFPHHDIRTIDAVILTHGHADAVMGLDDLRMWTLDARVQSSIPIYCDASTFAVVKGAFPYLVDTKKATGGGQIAALEFRVFDVAEGSLTVEGIDIIPFHVVHGTSNGEPYHSLGFRFPHLSYISDANIVPATAKEIIKNSDVLVLDALRETTHPSHLSFSESIALAVELTPKRLFFTDFCHDLMHEDMVVRMEADKDLEAAGIRGAPAYDGLLVPLCDSHHSGGTGTCSRL
ncbi:hypothetical protein BCR33DRAFT_856440 [Rhizoclosmatium globosum]|uniref:Metallo-beta-lactamase domain-containing protein n=1 Tax=Rhizoclosmatium globosum TaxID=329046 RepID=A0A1Y2BD20_9FUNG|nr:hypothetical protein BCR33DRAFT_856440 [Rhizoclosmatium globosum]|eukprot:ORY32721.1 hypothetical protein BCR33DRAFT_856440 [Rhizoclosmatium globosum]